MSVQQKSVVRCAIYTRKSSEEGLEQSFNSLDAQREACNAYVASQKHESWRTIPTQYDDGGYSGGSMERPALKRLLDDVADKKVDTIVVYKVDRLTRSLADFAKIVEVLDARGVSFVSVTQQFNTTTSMGRLTLNVLLSFAQFEREVTGERIRDKIAASKKKGMWMGGLVPLGYDLEGRKLVPNPQEAKLVCRVFSLYLKLGCVSKLGVELRGENVRSKVWITRTGARLGGVVFGRGALYALLRNRLYIGEIRHRDQWYPGEQKGIVPLELWNKVQAQLSDNLRARRSRVGKGSSSLLTGLIEDAAGNRFTPSFTIKKGRRYRYYVSQAIVHRPGEQSICPSRLPAHEIENRIMARLVTFLKADAEAFDELSTHGEDPAKISETANAAKKLAAKLPVIPIDDLRDLLACFLHRVIVKEDEIQVVLKRNELWQVLANGGKRIATDLSEPRTPVDVSDRICLRLEAKLKRSGGVLHLIVPPHSTAPLSVGKPKTSLLKAIARAHAWYERVLEGNALDQKSLARHAGFTERYVGKVFSCAFLAPDIVDAILQGRQPDTLDFGRLCKQIPLSWAEQRRQFGFPAVTSN